MCHKGVDCKQEARDKRHVQFCICRYFINTKVKSGIFTTLAKRLNWAKAEMSWYFFVKICWHLFLTLLHIFNALKRHVQMIRDVEKIVWSYVSVNILYLQILQIEKSYIEHYLIAKFKSKRVVLECEYYI